MIATWQPDELNLTLLVTCRMLVTPATLPGALPGISFRRPRHSGHACEATIRLTSRLHFVTSYLKCEDTFWLSELGQSCGARYPILRMLHGYTVYFCNNVIIGAPEE